MKTKTNVTVNHLRYEEDIPQEVRNAIAKINTENLDTNGGTLAIGGILGFFQRHHFLVLAYLDGEVVGYALIMRPFYMGARYLESLAGEIREGDVSWEDITKNEHSVYIAQIAVAKELHGHGIATQMLESLKDFDVVSNARKENVASGAMHLNNNFKVIGGTYGYDDKPYDLLYYRTA